MSIENFPGQVESQDALEPTQKLLAAAYVHQKNVRLKQTDENTVVIPPAVPTTPLPITYALSIVIPTRNERDNILPLIQRLYSALHGLSVEIIFVDDSDDDTPEAIKHASKSIETPLFYLHLEHRLPGEARIGGLATAVVEGLALARAKYVAVIDADLQHPPEQLRTFYEEAAQQDADLVLASRYINGGSYQGLDGVGRRLISMGMKWTAKLLFPEQLWRVSDPLGGFFLLRRSLLNDVSLRPIGYKILLEILIRTEWTQALEVPYHFQPRIHGKSKANIQQGTLALRHMLRLLREVPQAGRIWKINFLLLLNVFVTLMLFVATKLFSLSGSSINTIVFCVMACLDFFVFNRCIFPTKTLSRHAKEAGRSRDTRYRETFKLPAIQALLNPTSDIGAILRQGRVERLLSVVSRVALILAIVAISYILPGASLVIAVLFFGAAALLLRREDRKQTVTTLLVIATSAATIDYLCWRFVVSNWYGWWLSIPLLFAEVMGGLHTLGFQVTIWPRLPQKPEWGDDPTRLPVFIFIPTVNEGASVLRPTLEGVIAARDKYMARYPHGQVTIVVCNDGYVAKAANWQEPEQLAKELGVTCVTRRTPGGAKAGNIENARQVLSMPRDALMVIFDADQIAHADFLLKTVLPFRDTRMGWVQTGQYYANLDNPVSRWADDQQSMFYNLLCPGKAALNAAFICGTNVVIRSAALDQIGGLPQDSVTEDFAASINLHAEWRSLYLTDILATGLGPLDMQSYLKQQSRWAKGTLGVLRTHWRDILLPKRRGLSIEQRVQYFLACTHYLCGLRDFIYVVSPILFIFTGVPAVRNATLSEYLWHFVPYALLSVLSLWYTARGVTGLRGIIIGFGSFPVLIESLLSVVLGRKVGFAVTSKQRSGKRSLGYLWIYVLLFLLCVLSLLWAIHGSVRQQTSLFISLLWIGYSMLLLGSFLWLNVKDIRFQIAASKSANEVHTRQSYPSKLKNRQRGLTPLWNVLLGMLIALPILTSSFLDFLPAFGNNAVAAFTLSNEHVTRPYFGVSLPVQLLWTEPKVLEHDLNTQFSIIGRTQDIVHDYFDTGWAMQLAAHHTRPWITLQFGTFGPDGKPPLDASLAAIINGVHDQQIRKWAQDIRSFGRPVYLTILLHADRNWSLSSAVTNGGIPADVSQAWLHVRAIFDVVGARNVAWVWGMADPLHDQLYAPPSSAIDAVLQNFINYPETRWGDPQKVLHDLIQHYPTKPIIVEASVDGPGGQKAAWLKKLGLVVDNTPEVYALLYHEGGPELSLSLTHTKAWSLASDNSSLTAMQDVVAGLQTQAVTRSY